jgi:hypothetical protein
MEAAVAARIFHDWAASEGLMSEARAAKPHSTADELALVEPTSDVMKDILRRKGIQGFVFNESDHDVVVLTKQGKPTKKQLSLLPKKIGDVDLAYRQGAPNVIGGEPIQAFGTPPFSVRVSGGLDRYACGSSISQGNCRDAGTFGCLVRDAAQILYGLTNNHVSGGCSHAGVGLPILAPGVLDVMPVGHDPFTIGYHEKALEMVIGIPDNADPTSNLDAAIFKILDDALVTSHQGTAYDTPQTTQAITAGMTVEKVGRSTGHTVGKVVGQWYGALGVMYDMEIHVFKGRVFFDPAFVIAGVGALFADAGDSGALVTTVDAAGGRHAIGIIVGGMRDHGAPGGQIAFVLPIEPVLQKLAVTLVSGHNT